MLWGISSFLFDIYGEADWTIKSGTRKTVEHHGLSQGRFTKNFTLSLGIGSHDHEDRLERLFSWEGSSMELSKPEFTSERQVAVTYSCSHWISNDSIVLSVVLTAESRQSLTSLSEGRHFSYLICFLSTSPLLFSFLANVNRIHPRVYQPLLPFISHPQLRHSTSSTQQRLHRRHAPA